MFDFMRLERIIFLLLLSQWYCTRWLVQFLQITSEFVEDFVISRTIYYVVDFCFHCNPHAKPSRISLKIVSLFVFPISTVLDNKVFRMEGDLNLR